jgi:hypothetical protein
MEAPGHLTSVGEDTSTQDVSDIYRQGVLAQVNAHAKYFTRQMSRYRRARVVVIVSAALVPILSPIETLPRWALGALGGLAAIMESLNQLYRWRDSAVNAEKTGNALESELNRYWTRTRPYERDDTALQVFVNKVEGIRAHGSDAFAGLWSEDKPPSSQSGPEDTTLGQARP